MTGTAHRKRILGKDQWLYNSKTGDGLEVYEHIEKGWINLYNPRTDELIED